MDAMKSNLFNELLGQDTSAAAAIARTAELFLAWRDPMMRQLAVGPLVSPGLFAHRFAANAVLARLANASFQNRHWFAADHAFFGGFGHRSHCTRKLINCQSIS
jgi:hypothetical protein